jgi:plasmid stabilization system protein ParE
VTIRLVEAAEAELDAALGHYESESPGLGAEFLVEVISVVNRIAEFPRMSGAGEWVRRCRLNRFPYGIVYSLKADDIIVLGVAHLHRKPESWRTRLKKGRR